MAMHNYCTNWDAFPTEKLVGDINGGAGTSGLTGGAKAWAELAGVLRDANVSTQVALQSASASYTGQGAEAMTTAIAPFQDWADAADEMSGKASSSSDATSDAFSGAKNSMPSPGELIDPSTVHDSGWDKAYAWATNSQTDGEKAEAAAAAQHQQAAQAMSNYETAVYPHTQPITFPAPPAMTASSTPPPAASVGTDNVGNTASTWSTPTPTHSAWAPSGNTPPAPAQPPVLVSEGPRYPGNPGPGPGPGVPYPTPTPTPTPGGGYVPPVGTTSQGTGYAPPGTAGSGYGPGGTGYGTGGTGYGTNGSGGGSGAAGTGAGGFGGTPGTGGVGAGGSGDTAGARRAYGPGMSFGSGAGGTGGSGSGSSGRFGGGAYGGSGAGGSGGWGSSGSGAGGSSGGSGAGSYGSGGTAGAGGSTGAGGTGSGAGGSSNTVAGSNAAGSRGASGTGGAGGRGGQGAEDDEHATPEYLKQFEHFSDGRLVAPPVIGAD